ncbi:hypothetical protein CH063_00672 [Colletotrichum higginsianum]|uniref:Uncharacterized protein n=1 Tax=Colletotrichum higginsianum (strain IMI 349063) TaxID=759273 RepID=H1W488_COLHI|nr:hypothetical protein CH63R_04272 [Colletotrichum higginsianum IMI 349063]OBR11976.1 hypothetical protein CH63R_04272 [Colletotrichum higginsianum IMI 349063]CCF47301.1 hypothetical protein CH063_00672 [Colletotrichum higginsianum]
MAKEEEKKWDEAMGEEGILRMLRIGSLWTRPDMYKTLYLTLISSLLCSASRALTRRSGLATSSYRRSRVFGF